MPFSPSQSLPAETWQAEAARHEERVRRWTDPHQARVGRGEKHPVYDFLFEYYAYRAAWLRRFHPGIGVALCGEGSETFLERTGYTRFDAGVAADPASLTAERLATVRWLRGMLSATRQRPALFGCFGLHEWAMVYRLRPEEIRHSALPLRLPPAEIARIVESHVLCCTHFDAFRFFTPPARPLNRLALTREETAANEQRGCLHANMDLYKWAFKLAPFTPSDLVADCFELALEIRELDMCASPYDIRGLGFTPVAIETPEGKAEYEARQREFSRRSEPLRARLIAVCEALLAARDEADPSLLVREDRPAEAC